MFKVTWGGQTFLGSLPQEYMGIVEGRCRLGLSFLQQEIRETPISELEYCCESSVFKVSASPCLSSIAQLHPSSLMNHHPNDFQSCCCHHHHHHNHHHHNHHHYHCNCGHRTLHHCKLCKRGLVLALPKCQTQRCRSISCMYSVPGSASDINVAQHFLTSKPWCSGSN